MKAGKFLSYRVLALLAVLLGLAPFVPKPHPFEKIEMLRQGTLRRPVDIFDLLFHGWPLLLLTALGFRDIFKKLRAGN